MNDKHKIFKFITNIMLMKIWKAEIQGIEYILILPESF